MWSTLQIATPAVCKLQLQDALRRGSQRQAHKGIELSIHWKSPRMCIEETEIIVVRHFAMPFMDLMGESAVAKGLIHRCFKSGYPAPEASQPTCNFMFFILNGVFRPRKKKACRRAIRNPSLVNESLGTAPRSAIVIQGVPDNLKPLYIDFARSLQNPQNCLTVAQNLNARTLCDPAISWLPFCP